MIRPVRLVPNTTATMTAVTAAMDPSRVARTGTACWPDPGSRALRLATTAEAGRPATAAACAMAEGRCCAGWADRRTARPAAAVSSPSRMTASRTRSGAQHETVDLDPPGRVELAHRAHRGQRGERYRAQHGDDHAAEDRGRAWQAGPERRLRPGGPEGAHGRYVPRRPAEQLHQALPDEHQHGRGGDRTEHGQGDCLRPDRLLHLAAGDI